MQLFTTELKLLLRHWASWILGGALIALALLVILTSGGGVRYQYWPGLLLGLVNNLLFFQFPLLAVLVGSRLTQTLGARSDWLWAKPVAPQRLIGAQLGAILLVVGLGQLLSVALAIALLVAKSILPASAVGEATGIALLLLAGPTLLQIGTCVLLGALVRRTIWMIAPVLGFTVAVWLGLVTPVVYAGSGTDYTWLAINIQALHGLGPDLPLVLLQTLMYCCLGLLLLLLALLLTSVLDYRLQLRRHLRRALYAVGGLLVLSVALGGVQFGRVTAAGTVPLSLTPQPWNVVAAEHTGLVQRDTLGIEARLTLVNPTSAPRATVVLHLNTCLTVEQALQDGQAVAVARVGETVELTLAQPVAAQQSIELELAYSGRLCLLREDYAPPRAIRGSTPAYYAREVGNFQERDALWLTRDGDWRIWPQQAGPATAPQQIIALDIAANWPVIATTPTIKSDSYVWSGAIPQALVVAGDFNRQTVDASELWLPRHTAAYDVEYARRLTEIYAALPQTLGAPEFTGPVTIVLLPWLQNLQVSPGLVVAPLLDPARFDQQSALSSDYWSLRTTANRMVYAALVSRVPLTEQLTTTGQLVSWSTTCDINAPAEAPACTLHYDPANPQVLGQRWIVQYEQPALLQALSIWGGALVARELTHDEAAFGAELASWDRARTDSVRPALDMWDLYQLDSNPLTKSSILEAAEAYLETIARNAQCATLDHVWGYGDQAGIDWQQIEAKSEELYADCH